MVTTKTMIIIIIKVSCPRPKMMSGTWTIQLEEMQCKQDVGRPKLNEFLFEFWRRASPPFRFV